MCLLLPVAAPLILSFFLGIAIKEAEIEPFQKLLESTLTYTATLFLGLLLGTLCEAQTILDPKVAIILILVSARWPFRRRRSAGRLVYLVYLEGAL